MDFQNLADWLFAALVAVVLYVFNGLRAEIRADRQAREKLIERVEKKIEKLEDFMDSLGSILHDRVTKVEKSLEAIWTEHRIFRNHCGRNDDLK